MNKTIPRAALAASLLGLSACVSVPMAPLVYGSKTIGGLDISTTTTGTNPGVSISIGYKRDDLALVPVAVLEKKGQPDEKLTVITGTDSDGADSSKRRARATGNHSMDAMSVFGSFEGRGMAGASTPATNAHVVAANYFSTGVAAQNLADGVGSAAAVAQVRLCVATVKEVAADISDATERQTYVKKGLDACTSAAQAIKGAGK